MTLTIKKVSGKDYYYSVLSFYVIDKSRNFSKYIGLEKPSMEVLEKTEDEFRDEIITRLSKKPYTQEFVSKDDVIKSLLFRDSFLKKYNSLTSVKKKKYDTESIDSFTLTTLTTEEVDVDINDVINARKKTTPLTEREQISKNMLNAITSINEPHPLDRKYFLELHKTIMATFKHKRPGLIRNKNVHLYASDGKSISRELTYTPPHYNEVSGLLNEFLSWYTTCNLNPIEKSAMAHYKLYRLHPFLDGNKRMCRLLVNKTLFDEKFPLLNISFEKEKYFTAIISAVENKKPQLLVEFALQTYYKQVKQFISN